MAERDEAARSRAAGGRGRAPAASARPAQSPASVHSVGRLVVQGLNDDRLQSPASRPLQAEAVLALQRSHGNAFVTQLLDPVQREGGLTLSGGRGRSRQGLLGGENQLRLDPEIQAQIQALQAVQEVVTPANVIAGMRRLPLGAGAPEPASRTHPALAGAGGGPAPEPEPSAEAAEAEAEEEPRAGTPGDVLRAALADPRVGGAVDRLRGNLQRDWRRLGTGGQAAVVSSSVVLGGAALTGLLSSQGGRDFLTGFLADKVIPVPGVDGLGVQLNLGGDNLVVGLHLDVGRYLPRQLGFGPNAGPVTPLGARE